MSYKYAVLSLHSKVYFAKFRSVIFLPSKPMFPNHAPPHKGIFKTVLYIPGFSCTNYFLTLSFNSYIM